MKAINILDDNYYYIVLNLKTRVLTIKNYKTYTTSEYVLYPSQVKLLLFLSDNYIKENNDIKEFVRYNNLNSVTGAISRLNKKIKEVKIKNIHRKGYIFPNKILIDY